jgi:hypothetical protein
MRSPSLVVRHLLRRGLCLWLLVRLGLTAAVLLAAAIGGGEPPDLAGPMPVAIVFATMVGFVEARRLTERVLLANLGVSMPVQGALLALGGVAGEVLTLVLRRLA